MAFPATPLRRPPKTGVLRELVRETRPSPSDHVYPVFADFCFALAEQSPAGASRAHLVFVSMKKGGLSTGGR
jgi:hypothetical protein